MKRLVLILALTLGAKLSLLAEPNCHGAAALISNKIDESHASIHISAVMQCDDGRSDSFKSREAIIAEDSPREEVAKLIMAMAQEVVDHFEIAGIHSDVQDLVEHLKIRDDELPVPQNRFKIMYAPPFPPKTYQPTGDETE